MHIAKFDKSSVFDQAHEVQDYGPPQGRMSHASGLYGGCLVIHSGFNGQNDEILSDWAIFDIALGKWVRCKQPKKNKVEAYISPRYNHSMTVVEDPNIDIHIRNTRIMWIQEPYFLIMNQNNAYQQYRASAGTGSQSPDQSDATSGLNRSPMESKSRSE